VTEIDWKGVKWAERVLKSDKNPTMDKKLIITVCPVGTLIARQQNPNQPNSPREIADQAIASYHEGAAVAHLHNRGEHGEPSKDPDLLFETVDRILDACPDMIIQPSSSYGYHTDRKKPSAGATHYSYETTGLMVEALRAGGGVHNYMESTIFTPVSYVNEKIEGPPCISQATEQNARETITFLQKNGIKPEFMCHSWEGIVNVNEWLIKPGILDKPYLMSMGPGMHNAAETYPDPWGLMYTLGMMKMMPEGSVVSLSVGGRNWLPLTTFGILMGIDGVRVGMEDHLYMYPHKDELIENSADETRKIATIARELGRDVASPAEAREILGTYKTEQG